MNSFAIHYLDREFTLNAISSSRINVKLTFCFVNLLGISYLFYEFTINSLSISRIHYEFTSFFANSLSGHCLFRKFTSYSLSFSHFYYEFISCLAKSIRIYYLYREFTTNSLPCSRNHYEFTITSRIHFHITIYIAHSLWIPYLFLRFYFSFTIFFLANSNSIHSLFRESTSNSLSLSRTHYEFTTVFANLLWIHYFFAYSLSIYYLFREFTTKIHY